MLLRCQLIITWLPLVPSVSINQCDECTIVPSFAHHPSILDFVRYVYYNNYEINYKI